MEKESRHTITSDCETYEFVKPNYLGWALYIIVSICTFGVAALLLSWTTRLKYVLRYSKCSTNSAWYLLIDTHDGTTMLCKIQTASVKGTQTRFVEFRFVRYFWEENEQKFVKPSLLHGSTNSEILSSNPMNEEEIKNMRILAGFNSLETPITPIIDVLINEILSIYNIYQVIACLVWIYRDYALYAYMILITMFFTIIYDLIGNRLSELELRKKAKVEGTICVIRNERSEIKSSKLDVKELVPGDKVTIAAGKATCDIVITSGECLVDEAVLSGESVPVAKVSLANTQNVFDPDSHSSHKHMIFCGSTILKSLHCEGYVANTGFNTLKGQITRSILWSKKITFKHEKEAYRFLLVILFVSIIIMIIYYIYAIFLIDSPLSVDDIFYRGVDIIFISVPPGLPLCLLVAISFATSKLKKRKVTCLRPSLINAAGRVKTVCFDKTGTLTNSVMNLTGLSLHLDESTLIFNFRCCQILSDREFRASSNFPYS